MGEKNNNQHHTVGADAIRNLRLSIWREWERLLEEALDPEFSGRVTIELTVEAGKPQGKPRFTKLWYLPTD